MLLRNVRWYGKEQGSPKLDWKEELELYREFESGVLIDYSKTVEAEKEEGAGTRFHHFDEHDDDEKNAREVVRKYKALSDEVARKYRRRYAYEFDEPKELAHIHVDWWWQD
ncbi:unnamed protein product [Linum trigynum]|uniref:Uncharacterized protein n=1 Tax=Linum trigynum TaxID=586398 RepID=A0AAV2GT41_9ROSI